MSGGAAVTAPHLDGRGCVVRLLEKGPSSSRRMSEEELVRRSGKRGAGRKEGALDSDSPMGSKNSVQLRTAGLGS